MRPKLLGLALALVVIVLFSVRASADTVVRSFKSSANLRTGSVVALSNSASNTVELAPASDPSRLFGVVVDLRSAPLAIQQSNQKIYVATSGVYPVLVNNQNGTIKSGDYLSISKVDGIAAKATASQSAVLGQAAESLGGSSGLINVGISVGFNPRTALLPQTLRRVSELIAGKPVSSLRVYAALAVLAVTLLIAILLLLGGIRSGMIAIGRNPLSQHLIMRGLAQVMIAAAGVLIIGLLGVYLLLKL